MTVLKTLGISLLALILVGGLVWSLVNLRQAVREYRSLCQIERRRAKKRTPGAWERRRRKAGKPVEQRFSLYKGDLTKPD